MVTEEERSWAEFIDTLYHQADRPDVEYYRKRAAAVDGPVLEMACGTGRVYLELLRAGIDADGFDLSAPSLAVLRDRAAEEGLDPSVWQADMTDFTADREYALVTCPFNAFQRLLTHDDQRATLEGVYDVLAPGGRFIFDVFVPNFEFICDTYGEWDTRTVEFRGEDYEFRNRARLVDEIYQEVLIERDAIAPDGEVLSESSHRLTMLPKNEVELLLETSPFETVSVTGDFSNQQLADGHEAQVWVCKKV